MHATQCRIWDRAMQIMQCGLKFEGELQCTVGRVFIQCLHLFVESLHIPMNCNYEPQCQNLEKWHIKPILEVTLVNIIRTLQCTVRLTTGKHAVEQCKRWGTTMWDNSVKCKFGGEPFCLCFAAISTAKSPRHCSLASSNLLVATCL